jgi:5-methylcytosine-specific restriction protein A
MCPALVTRGHCAQHARRREHQRGNFDVRRWYRQARWMALRAQVLGDNPLCVDCQKEQRVTIATEVHHKVKPGGDPRLFFNRENLEGLCKAHHSAHTAKGE